MYLIDVTCINDTKRILALCADSGEIILRGGARRLARAFRVPVSDICPGAFRPSSPMPRAQRRAAERSASCGSAR